jgi:hypothetical protein
MQPLSTPLDDVPRLRYRTVLAWTFNALSSVRILTYLPTVAAILASGDSSQHSLWTWGLWTASNLSMALCLVEEQGGRIGRAAMVSAANASMCALTCAVIVWQRL